MQFDGHLVNKALETPLKILGKRFGFELENCGRVLVCEEMDQKGLKLNVTRERIEIKYNNLSSLFRAIGHVVMMLKEGNQTFALEEEQYFSFNGLMVDCSRNGVMNMTYGKELIERLAIMGHSVLMLYMEDVYEIENEPYFGYMRGRYTKQELKVLDAYAQQFGIELIPCIQTLAHLEQYLAWDHAKEKYLDIDNILCVGRESVKELIEKMIRQLADTFTSRRIHVGMDEAFRLGRGSYADQHGLERKSQIMKKHLVDVLAICEEYGLRPMIWDDMFAHHYEELLEEGYKIPEEIDLMYWDYYNNNQSHYESQIAKRKKISAYPMFAGGAWRWIGYAPHHTKTYVSTNAALMACKKEGIKEVLATSWADEGSEAPLSTALFGVVLFAEHGYQAEVGLEWFKKRLDFCTGLSYDCFMKQEAFDILPEVQEKAATVNPSKYMFYEDPLCSMFVYHTRAIEENLTDYYTKLGQYFEEAANNEKDLGNQKVHEVYSSFAKVLALKWNLGMNLVDAYKSRDKVRLEQIRVEQIRPLIEAFKVFGEKRFEEWLVTNKSIGYEVLDIRIGGLIQRLHRADRVVGLYLDGKIECIEELDEIRLPKTHHRQEGAGEMIQYNEAQKSMTAGKMCW